MKQLLLGLCFIVISPFCFAGKILNLYTWAADIPSGVIHQFEKETHIHVNHLSYDSNETMLAKLGSSRTMQFDIIEPTHFFLKALQQAKLIAPLIKKEFPEVKTLFKQFQPKGQQFYAIPYFTGATGILINDRYYNPKQIRHWRDLWAHQYHHSLLLLNEPRENFSMALIARGLDPNSENKHEINRAFEALNQLFDNIKLFNSDAQLPLFVDEDVTLGMIWNIDAARVQEENAHLHFIYPEDGFVLYNDCFAITRDAPHPEEAKQFLHFLLRPDIAAQISIEMKHAVTSKAAFEQLPKSLRNNQVIYPSESTLARGVLQKEVSPDIAKYYKKLWEKLKLTH